MLFLLATQALLTHALLVCLHAALAVLDLLLLQRLIPPPQLERQLLQIHLLLLDLAFPALYLLWLLLNLLLIQTRLNTRLKLSSW